MKRIISIIAAAIAAVSITSCNLLDVENPSGIYGSGYWKDKAEVEAYLVGAYTSFRSELNTLKWFEERGDSFTPGVEAGTSAIWSHNLTSTNGQSWNGFYTVIQHCNMIIKNADNVTFGLESERNNIKAQALSIRAYMYFCLVRTFGDAPIEVVPTEGSSKPKQPRAPKATVLQQVISDCETALALFSNEPFVAGKSKASRMGTYALLADAYLWKASVLNGGKADYEKVIEWFYFLV